MGLLRWIFTGEWSKPTATPKAKPDPKAVVAGLYAPTMAPLFRVSLPKPRPLYAPLRTPAPRRDDSDDVTNAIMMGAILGSYHQSEPTRRDDDNFRSGGGGDFGGGGASASWDPPAPSPCYDSPSPSPSSDSGSCSSSDSGGSD